MSKKTKYYVSLLRKVNNIYISVKNINVKDVSGKFVKYKNKSFQINYSNPNFFKNNAYYYFIDVGNSAQLPFIAGESGMSASELDTIVANNIVRDITRVLGNSQNNVDWFHVIMGVGIGLAIGFIVMYLIMQGKMDEMIELIANQYINPIVF